MFVHPRRLARIALTSLALTGPALVHPHVAAAQVRSFQVCSQGALKNCAGIRLTSQVGVGPLNTNRFEIGLQNLGSLTSPALATSLYFASFFTGLSAVGVGVDAFPVPVSSGGAVVSDATPWSLAETGDAIFLSPPGNNGIGGCAFSAPVGGFGVMGQTCGGGQMLLFSFFTSRNINVNSVTVADLEFVAIAPGNIADSCNDVTPCSVTSSVVTPEPASIALMSIGLVVVAVASARRRSDRSNRARFTTEM